MSEGTISNIFASPKRLSTSHGNNNSSNSIDRMAVSAEDGGAKQVTVQGAEEVIEVAAEVAEDEEAEESMEGVEVEDGARAKVDWSLGDCYDFSLQWARILAVQFQRPPTNIRLHATISGLLHG